MAQNDLPDTQTQHESQMELSEWGQLESQPIRNTIWGHLIPKKTIFSKFDLCNEVFSAGRDEDCDLHFNKIRRIPEKTLTRFSKIHFKISRDIKDLSSPVFIHDMSRNGTYVNKELIGTKKKRILCNDDMISLVHPDYKAFIFKDLIQNEGVPIDSDISNNYYISRKLGSGACGIVRLIYNKLTCEPFAMKQVQKNALTESTRIRNPRDEAKVMNEVDIMKALDHPCVIKMHDIINKPDSLYMVLDFMKGGELLTRITNSKNKYLSEQTSKLYFYQICLAVKYLHDNDITHRDLKPDNILLASSDEETLVKVSDFGLSKFVDKNSVMKTLCGTPYYVAPEVLLTGGRGSYTKKVDIWSLGVVLFTCLSGTLPFSDDYGNVGDQIKKGKFAFRSSAWKSVSPIAKSLILELLTVNHYTRPNISQILNHPWLRDRDMICRAKVLMNIEIADNKPDSNENEPLVLRENRPLMEPPLKRIRLH